MKMDKYLPYVLIGGLGIGVIYLVATRQQPAAAAVAAVPGAAAATEQYPVPSFSGEPSAGAANVTNTLLSMASQQLGLPPSELSVRGLRPQDLGLTTFNITAGGAGWTNVCTATVADNTFIAFTGCSYGGTNFGQLRIQAGARYAEYWPLTFIAGLVSQLWYDDSPSIAQQNQPVIIDAYAKAAATESINIMGTVVEKRGLTIA
jgi:hypothetical protein